MIDISVRSGAIDVNGHAYTAPPGEDLVCCAVSVLVQNMIYSIKALTEDKIEYDIQPGMAWMRYEELTDVSRALVDSFFVGICMLANNYPDAVRIV